MLRLERVYEPPGRTADAFWSIALLDEGQSVWPVRARYARTSVS